MRPEDLLEQPRDGRGTLPCHGRLKYADKPISCKTKQTPSDISQAIYLFRKDHSAGRAAHLAHALVSEARGPAAGGQVRRHTGPYHEGFGVIDANALAAHESHGERAEQRPASEGGQLRS